MRVEMVKELTPYVLEDVGRVLVRDSFGNPLALVLETNPNEFHVSRRGDRDFHMLLLRFGIIQTQLIAPITPTPPLEYKF